MSWFNTSGFANLAKSALSQAQKTIDKALDIKEEHVENIVNKAVKPSVPDDPDNFFATYGLGQDITSKTSSSSSSISSSSSQSSTTNTTTTTTTKSSSATSEKNKSNMEEGGGSSNNSTSGLWGSFAGSFFETVTTGSRQDSIDRYEDETFTTTIPTTARQLANPTIGIQPHKKMIDITQEPFVNKALQDDDNPVPYIDTVYDFQTSVPSQSSSSSIAILEVLDNDISNNSVLLTQPKISNNELVVSSTSKQQCAIIITNVAPPVDQYFHKDHVQNQDQKLLKSSDDRKTNLNKQITDLSPPNDDSKLVKDSSSLTGGDGDGLQNEPDQVKVDSAAGLQLISDPQSLSDPVSTSSTEDYVVFTTRHKSSGDDDDDVVENDKLIFETRADSSKNVIVESKGLQKQPCDYLVEKDGAVLITTSGCFSDSANSKDPNQSEDQKALSFISISSSSTTGESSSTLDDSIGTLSLLSEKGLSSATATPEVFSESTESFVPLGMYSSSGEELDDVNVHQHKQSLKSDVAGDNSRIIPLAEDNVSLSDGADSKTDLDVTLTEDNEEIAETVGELKNTEKTINELSSTLNDADAVSVPINGNSSKLISSDLQNEEKDITSQSNSSSLVSCMIEDAMTESVGGMFGGTGTTMGRAHSPNSTTSSTSSNAERSDPVKTTESEQNSGHTSGDELETTTSSDIEIISSPSMGGESGCERSGSISPIKQSSLWRRSGGNPGVGTTRYHGGSNSSVRSYSPASDTSSTKDTLVGHLVAIPPRPDLGFTASLIDKEKYQRKISETFLEQDGSQNQVEIVMRRISELSTILEAREMKILDVSRENADLKEKVSSLKSQLQKAGEVHAADSRDVSTLTKELTERLSYAEKNFQQALKEKESLKRDLQQATVEIASRVSATQVEDIKRERDTQIAELMQEGESLSKKILQYSNNVKKLRAKEKENETHIKQQREKIEEQSRELDRVRKALGAKEEVEKNQIELIRQLTNTVQKQEQEIENIKSELEDAQEKQRSTRVAMESAYKELAELHRKNAEQDSKVQEATLSAEMNAKEELRLTLEKLQRESKLQQEGLIFQIEELQLTISRNEQQAALREDGLRQDITHLQQRLQEAESRNDDLNQNVSAATRPLLRQIDNLQATLNVQTNSWTRVEHNLTERLNETQNHLVHATEKERAIAEKYADLGSKVASLEAQISSLRQEKVKLQAQLEASSVELQLVKESKERESASLKALKQTFAEEIVGLKRERDVLQHQLEIEKTALEAERRKTSILQDQVKEKDQKLSQTMNLEGSCRGTPSPQGSVSLRGSFSEHLQSSWYQDDISESGVMFSPLTNSRMNVYESLRAGSMATLLDSLQSQLKLRDGDISQLQSDIAQLERVKESMTVELVNLHAKIEELEAELMNLRDQKVNFQDTEQRYNALLQMYGEKIEEAEELKLDLQDVKDMYKLQIDELLRRK